VGGRRKDLSALSAIEFSADGKTARRVKTAHSSGSHGSRSSGSHGSHSAGDCGYSAFITKSTDGGKTWTTVFSDTTVYYFNEISCWTPTLCVAVAEGFSENAGVRIFRTTDGDTWKEVFAAASNDVNAYSFMSVEFASATDVWVGGSNQGSTQEALMFHSKDGGATWVKFMHGIPNIMEVTGLSFVMSSNGATGFASALTVGQTATILRFDRTHVGPNPVPPAAYFSQLTCLVPGCSELCQAMEFPEYTCVPASAGSVMASCGATDLIQVAYNTTDCTGPSQTSKIPLSECLTGSDGHYVQFQCGSGLQKPATSKVAGKQRQRLFKYPH
jgi:hypothetical protein